MAIPKNTPSTEDMELVNLEGCNLFASRKDINSAQKYFYDILESTPKENHMHLTTAFMVFWNTLSENYVIYRKLNKEIS